MKLALLLLAIPLFAQEPAKPAERPAPTIDPTAAAVFWKAQAELLSAKIALMEKDAAAQAALAKVSCGDGYEVAGSKNQLGLECKKK